MLFACIMCIHIVYQILKSMLYRQSLTTMKKFSVTVMKHLIVLAIVSTIASHALHGDPEFDVWYIDLPTCKDHNCNSSSWWETKKLPPYLCCCSDYKDQNVCCKCSDYKLLMDARQVAAIHGILKYPVMSHSDTRLYEPSWP